MKYKKQLETLQWLKKKNKILERDKYECTKCGCKTNLQVHHIYYVKDHLAWEYPNNALVTLCDNCHKKWHKNHEVEVRNIIWGKNKKYGKKKSKDNKSFVLAIDDQKKLQKLRNKKKELINKLNIDISEKKKILEDHKSDTIEELNDWLVKEGFIIFGSDSKHIEEIEFINNANLPENIKAKLLSRIDSVKLKQLIQYEQYYKTKEQNVK